MKYNFLAKLAVGEQDSKLMADIVPGLEVSANYKVQISVVVNTELPESLVEDLKVKLDKYFTEKLGEDVDVELVSVEH